MIKKENIISYIQQGDEIVFKEFFNDFYPILCSFAKTFLKSTDLSEDVAQESLVKYWNKREEFDTIQGVKSFLYVITRNQCINVLKRSKKSTDLESLRALKSESFLKKNIINQETFAIVHQAIASLPDRQREIIELSLQGIKNPEIAIKMQISENTVRTTKRNAFRKLRELLKDTYYLLLFV
ncbi:RNA polymerase sigma factor [Flavivirga sp. 57AJ16]|uniref:RNA polymerase sigma factor n=1 Tax=Flavivirga sp. 57AJ16 TaxID=3025307 RepID=UPI0023656F44|nr:RNA polymerase sigma-70 factor [Flavivirga sp. 57AJ16]MDD7888229.1 RNA polymerase sigma-70 factor [Flavivirga sp. 57AJ16]